MSDIVKRAVRRHIREKAVVRDAAKDVAPSPPSEATAQKSRTDDGLSVQDQVRKTWNPKNGGLPTFLRSFIRS